MTLCFMFLKTEIEAVRSDAKLFFFLPQKPLCCCSVAQSCPTLCGLMDWSTRGSPPLSPRVCSDSCLLSRWCHPTISSSVAPFSSCPQSFLCIRVFSDELALHIRWPKYRSFSFSISPSGGCSGLISFRIDCFDLLSRVFASTTLLQHQLFGA